MATDATVEVEPQVAVPDFSLEGKTAIVTGGSRGIGKAVALALAAQVPNVGADVLHRLQICRGRAGQIRDMGRSAEYFAHDVGDPEEVSEAGRRRWTVRWAASTSWSTTRGSPATGRSRR